MMDKPIIGLVGAQRSGKSTASRILEEELGFQIIGFADPIKEMLTVLGVPTWIWESDKKESAQFYGQTPRYLARTLGTEWGRDMIDSDLWVQVAEYRMSMSPAKGFIISDVRFDNEATWLRGLGGVPIYIERPGYEWSGIHGSEVGPFFMEGEDRIVINDSTLEIFKQQIIHTAYDLLA